MSKASIWKLYLSLGLMVGLLLTLSSGLTAQEPDPKLQSTPTRIRPTVDPGSNTVNVADKSASVMITDDNCASVYGSVILWGVGGQGEIGLALRDGGWGTHTASSGDGHYNFGALGVGAGVLSIETGLAELTPMVDQAAIPLSCDFPIQANIGLYGSGERPTPPGQLTMRADTQFISPGDQATFTLQIKNTLPNPISQVLLTDLFPAGLTIVDAQTSQGKVEIHDQNLLAIQVGSVPEAGTVTVVVKVKATDDLTTERIQNRATLFYAESVADQATLDLTVLSQMAAVEPDTTVAVAAAAAESDATMSVAAAAAGTETTTDQEASAVLPDVLPVTGLGLVGTVVGFPLALLAIVGLLVKGVASVRRRE